MDPIRRNILATGAAATAMAAAPRLFAQETGHGGAAMSFYEKGPVRIHYEEAGSGFPLLLIAGGGLNSTIAGLGNPFNVIEEFKGEYRCIAADLRNANPGQEFFDLLHRDVGPALDQFRPPALHIGFVEKVTHLRT